MINHYHDLKTQVHCVIVLYLRHISSVNPGVCWVLGVRFAEDGVRKATVLRRGMQENEGVCIPTFATDDVVRRCEYGVDICGPAAVAMLLAGRTAAAGWLLFVVRIIPFWCSFKGFTTGLRASDDLRTANDARAFDTVGRLSEISSRRLDWEGLAPVSHQYKIDED